MQCQISFLSVLGKSLPTFVTVFVTAIKASAQTGKIHSMPNVFGVLNMSIICLS